MEFVTSSKGKPALMQLCSDVYVISSETILGLANLEKAVQSSVTLAAWRYPWRYWSASALRLVLTIDGTYKRLETCWLSGDPNKPTQAPTFWSTARVGEGQWATRPSRRDAWDLSCFMPSDLDRSKKQSRRPSLLFRVVVALWGFKKTKSLLVRDAWLSTYRWNWCNKNGRNWWCPKVSMWRFVMWFLGVWMLP